MFVECTPPEVQRRLGLHSSARADKTGALRARHLHTPELCCHCAIVPAMQQQRVTSAVAFVKSGRSRHRATAFGVWPQVLAMLGLLAAGQIIALMWASERKHVINTLDKRGESEVVNNAAPPLDRHRQIVEHSTLQPRSTAQQPHSPTSLTRAVQVQAAEVWDPLFQQCAKEAASPSLRCLHKSSTPPRGDNSSTPLWARTMLRDAWSDGRGSSAAAKHHYIAAMWTAPHLLLCTIPKSASTTWNAVLQSSRSGTRLAGTRVGVQHTESTVKSNRDWLSAVVLRDPLARFLSAYIDKCEPAGPSAAQQHCEPTEAFTQNCSWLRLSKQARFREFVARFPSRKWNVHFIPQTLFCEGLWRSKDQLDVVMEMNATLADQVAALAHQLDCTALHDAQSTTGPKPTAPAESARRDCTDVLVHHFRKRAPRPQVAGGGEKRGTTSGGGTAHLAALEYFDTDTLADVLTLVGVDYATLNLTIPAWTTQVVAAEHLNATPSTITCRDTPCPASATLPLPATPSCQNLSDWYGIDGRLGFWGSTPASARGTWMKMKPRCRTRPAPCPP
eukprot:m.312768 g.312768  ORF g.312768 m.312768 type:complete len:560 (+) comp27470_c0_seq1:125-1804(+)